MNLLSSKLKDFTSVYSDFYPVVYNSIYAKLRDDDASSDIAQEVFTRLLQKIDEVDNPRAWLFGTMKLVLFEHYRRKSGNNDIDIESVFNDVNMRYVNGFRDTRIIIQEALASSGNYADEYERIVFDLIALNDYTYREAAEQTGLTERQVRYRYNAASKRIIDYLKKKGSAAWRNFYDNRKYS